MTSTTLPASGMNLIDRAPPCPDLIAEALKGLRASAKTLPCKLLYDAQGSRLFEAICATRDYYVFRTELGILDRHLGDLAEFIGADAEILEFGSGCGLKTRMLLAAVRRLASCVIVDISRETLHASAASLASEHPGCAVTAVCADYTLPLAVPRNPAALRRVVFFPGSTIGNFTPAEAQAFLARTAGLVGPGGGLIIGVDLVKDPAVLARAYDDSEGVTAAFNRNLLSHLNPAAGADFDPATFDHRALVKSWPPRVEMHLVSRQRQAVRIGGTEITFAAGESIRSEQSHRYSLDRFSLLAQRAGWRVRRRWMDPKGWFAVFALTMDNHLQSPDRGR